MEPSKNHLSIMLLISALAIILAWALSLYMLTPFQDIQQGFNYQAPEWLAWVMPTFRFWIVLALCLAVLFLLSLNASMRQSIRFMRAAQNAAFLGYGCAILIIVFVFLAAFWPLFQTP
ncbi:hypothetical protein PN836_004040 [Ningiella sp. W23]|uniref:hypothetical protein n=1 Tax=Ningiella sp. W23 TaxID=3023715 RepID=UPI0037575AC6